MLWTCVICFDTNQLSCQHDLGFEYVQEEEMFQKVQAGCGAQAASYSKRAECAFPGVNPPEREFDHSPSYSAEVRNECRDTCTPP